MPPGARRGGGLPPVVVYDGAERWTAAGEVVGVVAGMISPRTARGGNGEC